MSASGYERRAMLQASITASKCLSRHMAVRVTWGQPGGTPAYMASPAQLMQGFGGEQVGPASFRRTGWPASG